MSLLDAVSVYVEANVASFHDKRLDSVRVLELDAVLRRKNPYLFKTKYTQTAEELVRGIMDAFISSQEETLFGDFLEGVAIFVCEEVYGGWKPEQGELTGIDLVFEKQQTIYIVEIKSGPNWGNSSQITKMVLNFRDSIVRLAESYPGREIVPINGCMYGKDSRPQKLGKIKQEGKVVDTLHYWKLCGQDFWHFISDNPELYVEIIEPLGYKAKERNEMFQSEYAKLLNKFSSEFLNKYCNDDWSISWERLARFVSESKSTGNPIK